MTNTKAVLDLAPFAEALDLSPFALPAERSSKSGLKAASSRLAMRATIGLVVAVASPFILTAPVYAQATDRGGSSGAGAPGGASNATGTGGQGANFTGSPTSGGGGGGAGETGGAGGSGYTELEDTSIPGGAGGTAPGQAGGTGTSGRDGVGGGGGGGAHGYVGVTLPTTAVTGGAGGNGGISDNYGFGQNYGGGGGAGGFGAVVGGAGNVIGTLGVNVTGGRGGNGGSGDNGGGSGGSGGIGLVVSGVTNSSITISSGVTVQGGAGGLPGTGSFPGALGTTGNGGVGILVAQGGATIDNSGTIAGGNGAAAITFTNNGNVNRVILRDGAVITGNVIGAPDGKDPARNDLILAFNQNSTFDISALGRQYANFSLLNHTGSGTTTLTGDNLEYLDQGFNVYAGTILVDGTLSAGGVSVENGGTIGGSGTIGAYLLVQSGGTLAPGNSPGTLRIDNDLYLYSGSVTNFQLGTPGASLATVTIGGATNDLIEVRATANLGGTLNVTNASGGQVAAGYYRLINAGSVSGTFATVNAGSATGTVLIGADQVNLLVEGGTAPTLFWNGSTTTGTGTVNGGAGTWDAATTNWTDAGGTSAGTWGGGTAIFAGTGGAVTVSGTHNVIGLQFSSNGYTLSGGTLNLLGDPDTTPDQSYITVDSGVSATIGSTLTGGKGLVVTGPGTLVLTANNNYTGETTIDSGATLQLGNSTATGSLGSGAIENNGLLVFKRSTGLIVAQNISGSGGLTQNGSAQIDLNGTNTYTGTTTVLSNFIILNSGSAIADTGAVVVNGGGIGVWASETIGSLAGTGGIIGTVNPGGATLTVGGSNATTTYAGQLINSGTGTFGLTHIGTGTLILTGNNNYNGTTTISSGTLQIGNGGTTGTLGTGAVINNGNLVFNRSDAVSLGSVSGTGTVTQAGSGTLSLTGKSYGGNLAVKSGTLAIGASTTLSGGVTVTGGSVNSGVTVDGKIITTAPNGIGGSSTSGNIAISIGATGVIDPLIGINLSTVSGAITVGNAGLVEGDNIGIKLISSGTGAVGALRVDQTGTGTIQVTNAGGGAQAVYLQGVDANLTVTGNGASTVIDATNGSAGVEARSTGKGQISVSDNTISGKTYGILAIHTGAGAGGISVTGTGDVSAMASGGKAIDLQINNAGNSGDIIVDRTGDLSGDRRGVSAIIYRGSGDVDVKVTGNVTSVNDTAINAEQQDSTSLTGTVSVTTSAGSTIASKGGSALYVQNQAQGGGGITINSNAALQVSGAPAITAFTGAKSTGSIVINANGAIGSGTSGAGTLSTGILASGGSSGAGDIKIALGADIGSSTDRLTNTGILTSLNSKTSTGNTVVTLNNASIYASQIGINATTTGSGDISIIGTGTGKISTTASFGVVGQATAGGDVLINLTQAVSSGVTGIFGSNLGSGNVSVTASGAITTVNGSGITASNSNSIASTGKIDVTLAETGSIVVGSGQNGISANSNKATGGIAITVNGSISAGFNAIGVSSSANGGLMDIRTGAKAELSGANGIVANSNGAGGSILITHDGKITASGIGVSAFSSSATVGDSVTIVSNGTISAGGTAISAQRSGAAGAINITLNGAITANKGLAGGISAINSSGGAINIAVNADIGTSTAAAGSEGINARISSSSGKGDIDIKLNNASVYQSAASGNGAIRANNAGIGGISITGTGTGLISSSLSTPSSFGTGVLAVLSNSSATGNLTIDLSQDVVTTGGGDAIFAQSVSSGNISITARGNVTQSGGSASANNSGILAFYTNTSIVSAHAASITINTSAGKTVSGQNVGIWASGKASTGGITINAASNVVGTNQYGILATLQGIDGDILINNTGGASVTGKLAAIAAQHTGRGGAVTINASGPLTATGGAGIEAIVNSTDSADGIAIVSEGTIKATTAGITATRSNGAGGITITANGPIMGNAELVNGIVAANNGGGAISIAANGSITTTSNGINATNGAAAANTGTIDVALGKGAVLTAGGTGIFTDSGQSSGTTTITVAGMIDAGSIGIKSSSTSGAIITNVLAGATVDPLIGIDQTTVSGAITVNNAGLIEGDNVGVQLVSTGTGSVGDLTVAQTGTGTIQVTNAGGGLQAVRLFGVDANIVVTGNGASTIIDASNGTIGIDAQTSGTGAISIADNTISGTSYGIYASQFGAATTGISVSGSGDISATNGRGVDLLINNVGNSGSINYDRTGAVSGTIGGIRAIILNGTGDVIVNAKGDVTATTGPAIFADHQSLTGKLGNVSVTTQAGSVIRTSGLYGISATSQTEGAGTITVNSNAAIQVSGGTGIFASRSNTSTGDIVINSNAAIGSGTGGPGTFETGVRAFTNAGADGNLVIGVNADIGSATDVGKSSGIALTVFGAASPGNITLNLKNASVYSTFDAVNAYNFGLGGITVTGTGTGELRSSSSYGITAQINQAKNSSAISVDVSQNVSGLFGGIAAATTGTGNVTVDAKGNVAATSGTAIQASIQGATPGTGKIAVTTGSGTTLTGVNGIYTSVGAAAGGTTITVNGNIAVSSIGVQAQSNAAGGDIVVTTAKGTSISAGGTGIFVAGNGSGGAVLVTTNGTISSGANGISASGNSTSALDGVTIVQNGAILTSATGISAQRFNGAGAVSVTSNATIGGSKAFASGIVASNFGGGSIMVTANADIGTTGLRGTSHGISANAGSVAGTGNVTVTLNNASIYQSGNGSFWGIRAFTSGLGNVSVISTGTGSINAASAGAATGGGGVLAQITNASSTGNVLVDLTHDVVASNNGNGIVAATAGQGNIDVVARGNITHTGVTGGGNNGIIAYYTGTVPSATAITITTSAGKTVAGGSDGIWAEVGLATGGTTINASSNVIGVNNGGIHVGTAGTAGNIMINNLAGASVTGKLFGIEVEQLGSGGAVTINTTGTVSASAGSGIKVTSNSASAGDAVTVVAGGTIKATSAGITVSRNGGAGAIDITANGAISGNSGLVNGIVASTSGGGAITIKANAGITTTAGSGIVASNTGKSANTGAINITLAAGQLISATGGNGIETSLGNSTGTATVTVNGMINASGGSGIKQTAVAGNNTVIVTATGSIDPTYGIDQQTASGANLVNNAGLVEGDVAGIRQTATTTGTASVINTGTVAGVQAGSVGVLQTVTDGSASVSGSGTISGAVTGIQQTSSGAGNLSVSGSNVISGTLGFGVYALNSGGSGTITIATTGGSISGATGILARSDGTGSISLSTVGNVTGTSGAAISALQNGTSGNVDVQVNGGTILGALNAIEATSTNGNVSLGGNATIVSADLHGIVATANGTVDVLGTGTITALKGIGIYAVSTGGQAVTVSGTGSIDAGSYGIYAFSNGGDVTVAPTGSVTAASDGILAQSTGSGKVAITTTAAVTGTNGTGVTAVSGDGAVSLANSGGIKGGLSGAILRSGIGSITVSGKGQIDGSAQNGIDASTDAGIAILSTGGVSGAVDGVLAVSTGTGDVSVNGAGKVSGTSGTGIAAASTGGNVVVAPASTVTGGLNGINAQTSGTGTVSVTTAGLVTGTSGTGVIAVSGDGAITLANGGGISGGINGVVIQSTSGAVKITGAGDTTGKTGTGILAITTGGIAVQGTGAVSGGTDGIYAYSGGTGNVTVSGTGTVTGTSGTGIVAGSSGGNVVVAPASTVTGGVNGIIAQTSGAGTVAVTTLAAVTGKSGVGIGVSTGNGNATITNGALVTGKTVGVQALSSGAGNIMIAANAGITATAGNAVVAINSSKTATAATITITQKAGTIISATGGNGIATDSGLSTGATVINVNGDVLATGQTGVLAYSTKGDITLNVSATGRIDPVIGADLVTVDGALSVNNLGLIEGDAAGVRLTASGTGTASVINFGTISGGAYSVLGSTANRSFTIGNAASGTLNGGISVTGSSVASSTFTNHGTWNSGSIASSFSGNLVNTGTINVFGGGSALFSGTASNSGRINLGSPATLTVNGAMTNTGFITGINNVSGNNTITVGGNYVGGGLLGVDINTANSTADMLKITGTASGTTTVFINQLGRGLLPTGFLPVVTTGGASSGAFVSGTSFSPLGLVLERFGQNPANANQFGIVQGINPSAGQLTSLSTFAGTLSRFLDDPIAPLVLDKADPAPGQTQVSLWLRGGAGEVSQNIDFRMAAGAFGQTHTYRGRTNYSVLQGGIDVGVLNMGDKGWNGHIGLMFGGYGSDTKGFNGNTKIDATFAGGYVFFTGHGLTLDANVRREWRDFKMVNPTLFATGRAVTKGTATGGAVTLSYRLPVGAGGFALTPVASYSFGNSSIDPFGLEPGSVYTPGDDKASLGKFGGRFSYAFPVGGNLTIEPFAGAYWLRNWSNVETGSGTALGGTLTAQATAYRTGMTYDFGLTLKDPSGRIGAFIKGSNMDTNGLGGTSLSTGVRINF